MQINQEIEQITDYAISLAKKEKHEYMLVEHLLVALISYEPFYKCLHGFGVDVDSMVEDLNTYTESLVTIPMAADFTPKRTNAIERVFNRAVTQVLFSGRKHVTTIDLFLSITGEQNSHAMYFILKYGVDDREAFAEYWSANYTSGPTTMSAEQAEDVLKEHCTNLSEMAEEKLLEPLIGRTEEIRDAIDILAKKFKANVLMIGDPGVGKTAIVEGLAQKILDKQVPTFLEDHTVWSLEIGSMLAGSKYRGDFEEKFQKIIQSLETAGKSVLFIDEAHTMKGAGAGGTGSSLDFANMLKPAITRGKIKVIANTTWDEYYESFEKDKALMRRFFNLTINEPDQKTTVKILTGVGKRLAEFHDVTIKASAIAAAVDLSNRFIHDRKNPDKSIDMLDAACAKERAADNSGAAITPDHIIAQVAKVTGVPAERLRNDQSEKLRGLEKSIKTQLYGQDQAIADVLDKVYVNFSGLAKANKPVSSFLFLGPSGTGKTEMAKLLSSNLDMELIRFDMSEYGEKHTVSSLIGAPPGYVGFEEGAVGGGKLISAVSKNPYSVLLFDEIEKAHPDILNIFLQMLDEGKITSSSGKEVRLNNCIIIMTSNLGAQANDSNNIGFGKELARTGEEDKAVKDFMKPELRNRIEAIVKFNKLDKINIKKIVNKFIKELKVSLKGKKITISVTEALVNHLADAGYDATLGARPISRKIDDLIKVPLGRKILFDDLKDCKVVIGYTNDEVTFTLPGASTTKVLPRVKDEPEITAPTAPAAHTSEDGTIVLDQFSPDK